MSNLSKELTFKCGETQAQRLVEAKDDCTAHANDPSAPGTVLYLAYGSNLSSRMFLGIRKIQPLSRINVYAPSLRLTFSLPGIAYIEPCFANVEYREDDKTKQGCGRADEGWDGCLVGVVYEVTKSDWRKIMSTEGSGAHYREIVVSCVPLPEDETAVLPKFFMARTLYASRAQDSRQSRNCSPWHHLTTGPFRPGDDYAQPSQRYMNLLRTGAKEHGLPQAYRDYLDSIEPHTITKRRQWVGKVVLLFAIGPPFLIALFLSTIFADKTGKMPKAMTTVVTVASNLIWILYDNILKPIFGDGERTERDRGAQG